MFTSPDGGREEEEEELCQPDPELLLFRTTLLQVDLLLRRTTELLHGAPTGSCSDAPKRRRNV